ncbi:Oidioi.mRNA.OKI2018_I69.XSR.g13245.t1.cds [Oikopleura dioica]|uniref:Oidioi.mRNA.OKI2018_I69.XSR.g13245.t1.cds n=1 Tax=Oikopleura dioica TaxID=34765 RepID=A0ABN7SA06_OIKDI|nr:Oidioi.mRNA.OKI2018_I69.XSR.g13245.t1.cds [Oikopleura dioica]
MANGRPTRNRLRSYEQVIGRDGHPITPRCIYFATRCNTFGRWALNWWKIDRKMEQKAAERARFPSRGAWRRHGAAAGTISGGRRWVPSTRLLGG